MLILLASLLQAVAPAPATVAPAADEIVVTAKRDKCFVAYANHQVTDSQLDALSRNWAAGTPVKVIEPRGASIRCEFHIMQYLNKHGVHMAQFVYRVEDQDDAPDAPATVQTTPPPPVAASLSTPTPSPAPPVPPPSRRVLLRSRTAQASAGPGGIVTLICTMNDPGRPYTLDVEVNEAKGTVTPSRPDTGGGSEMKALFMPEAVRFGPFTLSRTTLRIERINGGTLAPGEAAAVEGQCAMARPARMF